MHPQTLRKYERLGLINPARTVGMLRLYSQDDIRRIKLIRHLTDNLGLNLNGVVFALALVENLLGFWERTAPLSDDDPAKAMVEKEILQLFRNLNLPLEQ
ncbi:MAG: MerR family transcriptional regulator [Chloroflexi bacterium]|nr:MerR family transcriptional regulator [Chloroflexota bacterium]MCH8897087.1 MerR family transcriptional regulator [Chloroflexota bacterium]